MPNRKSAKKYPFGFRTIQEYLEVPLRRPLFVLVPAVLVLSSAIALAFVLPKKYRSQTLILVESEKVPDTFVRKIATETMARRLYTIRQEVLSRTRLERVIEELDPYPSEEDERPPMSVLVERMRRAISIETRGSDAFSILYVHTDPMTAMTVTNRLATLFIEEAEKEREVQATEGVEFIESQLTAARKELEEKEEAVRRFKERRLGSLPEQLSTNLATLQRLQLEQQTVAENLRAAQTRVDLLRMSMRSKGEAVAGVVEGPDELDRLRGELATLRTRYTDQHPDVQVVLRQIRELESAESSPGSPLLIDRDSSTQRELRQAEAEVARFRAKQADLDEEMMRIQARVDLAPRTEQELATLTRDYAQLQEGYVTLLRKQRDAEMAEQLEQRWKGERFKVLDPAHFPDKAFFPSRTLFAFLGLVGGLGLGLVSAFAVELLDHSIKNADQLEELFSQPLLATIPHITPGFRRAGDKA
jgi:polysaccharide chain length determinant protein (PEP-CTERM system associated)